MGSRGVRCSPLFVLSSPSSLALFVHSSPPNSSVVPWDPLTLDIRLLLANRTRRWSRPRAAFASTRFATSPCATRVHAHLPSRVPAQPHAVRRALPHVPRAARADRLARRARGRAHHDPPAEAFSVEERGALLQVLRSLTHRGEREHPRTARRTAASSAPAPSCARCARGSARRSARCGQTTRRSTASSA